MKYITKINLQLPSDKAILHAANLNIEFIETQMNKLRALLNSCGQDLHQDVLDYTVIKDVIENSTDSDHLLSALCSEEIGIGYLLGAAIAVMEMDTLEDTDG